MSRVLAVDLDRTLIKQDSTLMCLRVMLRKNLKQTVFLFFKLSKSEFKNFIIENTNISELKWKYNLKIKIFLQSSHANGVSIFLVTGAPDKIASAIVDDLGIFTGYYCSSDKTVLKFEKKAQLLIEIFGKENFDYIGDSFRDKQIWLNSKNCYAPKSRFTLICLFKLIYPTIKLRLI